MHKIRFYDAFHHVITKPEKKNMFVGIVTNEI